MQLSSENERYAVTATAPAEYVSETKVKEVNREVRIRIDDKRDAGQKEVVYRQSFHQFKEMVFCAADKIVLIGELPYGGDSITVLDAREGQVQDEIRAYGYSISPSKQFMAYKTWYARLGPMNLRKSILVIYDLAGSASANRPPCIEEHSFRNAGFPIFPEVNAESIAPEPDCSDAACGCRPFDVNLGDEYGITSPFLWSEDSKRLVFFAHNSRERKNDLVRIDLTDGIDKVAIARQRVNLDDHIKWDVISDFTGERLAERPYVLGVTNLCWDDEDRILVETYRQYWLDEKFEMQVP